MKNATTTYLERELINGWEATYKQGLLTLWVFLALHESPKTLVEIRTYLDEASRGTIAADDKSLYRSLRRYAATEMVDSITKPSKNGGPPLKLYSLSETGRTVLGQFVERNIPSLIYNQQIKEILS